MHRIIKPILASVLGGTLALSGLYMATSWSMHARLETAARKVSQRAAKQDPPPVIRVAPARTAPVPFEPHQAAGAGGGATS